jgi:DNA recombination protein RmuC
MKEFLHSFQTLLLSSLPTELPLGSALLLSCATAVVLFFLCAIVLLRSRQLSLALHQKNNEVQTLQARATELTIAHAELKILLRSEREHSNSRLQLLEDARRELKLQFENLASRIFDEKSQRFSELNRDRLEAILTPFSKEIGSLKKEMNEIYRVDSGERISLKQEIVQLRDLNQQINKEATNLTRALQSDSKSQGDWGELVLDRILEASGLKKGIEYSTQGGYRDHNNRLFKPDVVIHLPEGKEIIVDSKVSLTSWTRYVNSESKTDMNHHLQRLKASIKSHISELSEKNYPGLQGLHSLDFVLMFIPVEAAFATVCKLDDTLITNALTANIVIVTPTTLLATLRTIENIWKFEHQSRNSAEIARRAGLMYDKFRGLIEDMEKIGKQLANCHSSYEGALLKLTRGRGNLVSQAEQLKELGVQVKKELPQSITEVSELELRN